MGRADGFVSWRSRRTERGRAVAALIAFGLVGLAAADARGDEASEAREKSVCSAKYQGAQRLRAEGKLTLARGDLLRCAEQACPAFVSSDCKTWLVEVEAQIPTLVFAVLDPDGDDVPNAQIRVDGIDVPHATDGLGHALDPGEHAVDALVRGETIQRRILVRLGEKARRIELRLAGPPSRPAAVTPPRPERAKPPVGAYVLGAVGLAAIGVGTVLWATGSSAAHAYNADCETTGCTSAQRQDAMRQLVAGDIAWGAGAAAGVAAVVMLLLPRGSAAPVQMSLGLGTASLLGRF